MSYRLGLLLALVGSALIFVPQFADAFNLIKIAPALIGLLFLWGSCIPARFPDTGIGRPLVACAAAFIISLIYSIDSMVGLTGIYSQPFHGALALIPAAMIFYAVCSQNEQWKDGPLVCAASIAMIQGVVCALQIGGLIRHPFDMISGRAVGTMGSPVFLGAILAPCIPVSVWMAARGSVFGWAAAIGGFLALAASGSRGPWISALAGLWGYLWASGRVRPRLRHLLAAIALGACGIAISGAMGKLESDRGRLAVWKVAYIAGIEHPIAGWGPDTFSLAMRQTWKPSIAVDLQGSAHNDLLQAWATTGILGLAAYLWLWAALLTSVWRVSRWDQSEGAAAVFGSLLALFVAAKFNPVPPTALFIAAALAGSVFGRIANRPDTPSRSSVLGWSIGFGNLIASIILCGLCLTAEALHSYGVIAVVGRDINRGADLLRRANELYPAEVTYAARRCELIFKIAPSPIFNIAQRRDFSRRAIAAAAMVVSSHGQDPASYELMSTSELLASEYLGRGLSRAAMRSAKRAHELNPTSQFAIFRWNQAAIVSGDVAEELISRRQIRR